MVSSANKLTVDVKLSAMSFMQNRKSQGPSTDPWGTPEITGTQPEEAPSTRTDCERSLRKFPIQVFVLSSMPYILNFSTKRLCSTLSKALEKSRTQMSVWSPSRMLFTTSCTWDSSPVSNTGSRSACFQVRPLLLSFRRLCLNTIPRK